MDEILSKNPNPSDDALPFSPPLVIGLGLVLMGLALNLVTTHPCGNGSSHSCWAYQPQFTPTSIIIGSILVVPGIILLFKARKLPLGSFQLKSTTAPNTPYVFGSYFMSGAFAIAGLVAVLTGLMFWLGLVNGHFDWFIFAFGLVPSLLGAYLLLSVSFKRVIVDPAARTLTVTERRLSSLLSSEQKQWRLDQLESIEIRQYSMHIRLARSGAPELVFHLRDQTEQVQRDLIVEDIPRAKALAQELGIPFKTY